MKPEQLDNRTLEQVIADLEKFAKENGRIIPDVRRVSAGHSNHGFVRKTHATHTIETLEKIEDKTDKRNHPND
jgi:uncharacterized protein (UPF0335 family)